MNEPFCARATLGLRLSGSTDAACVIIKVLLSVGQRNNPTSCVLRYSGTFKSNPIGEIQKPVSGRKGG